MSTSLPLQAHLRGRSTLASSALVMRKPKPHRERSTSPSRKVLLSTSFLCALVVQHLRVSVGERSSFRLSSADGVAEMSDVVEASASGLNSSSVSGSSSSSSSSQQQHNSRSVVTRAM
jgi:hypothetical protein